MMMTDLSEAVVAKANVDGAPMPAETVGAPIPLGRVARPRPDPRPGNGLRPRVAGRFLYVGAEKLWVRGVTYGTFLPGESGEGYERAKVDVDFPMMASAGINAIRLYTLPPVWLLDAAQRHGIWVMLGNWWGEHVAFLDGRERREASRATIREGVRRFAGHPAVLAFNIGNEIPSRIVRWHGAVPVQDHLERLADDVRAADPGALVTYANYPSTEYLRVAGLDFDSWNLYLEQDGAFERYVARLQNLSPDRPVVLAEFGADSRSHGVERQAEMVSAQARAAFAAGSSGTFAFGWTDEWATAGTTVEDWDFGLTTRDRQPKPSLEALTDAYRHVPFSDDLAWPRISVVCCSYNGERFIDDCLAALARQDYPDFEVIVIDDGSTDRTAEIAARYDVRLTSQENKGLSAARNEGMRQATGEIIAYIDDDAYPDLDWLRYIAWVYLSGDADGAGGPNLPPPGDGELADLVALAPGGPNHVLITDTAAEHIPGCNSTYRTEALRAIDGYDTRYRTAGDDVDVGWRIQENGGSIGFSPGAMVWHHRRTTARGYLSQQRGYGYAEALLEKKWPSRFNALGHVTWPGQLYGPGARPAPLMRSSVYAGTWGSAPFQSIYERGRHWATVLLMPEWWIALGGLVAIGFIGLTWFPLLVAWPIALAMLSATLVVASAVAVDQLRERRLSTRAFLRGATILAALIIGQSLYRSWGRVAGGLTPFRRRGASGWTIPRVIDRQAWDSRWRSMEDRLRDLEAALEPNGAGVSRGGPLASWDIDVRTGSFGSSRLLGAAEEHGNGTQLVRWRAWPKASMPALLAIFVFGIVGTAAWEAGAAAAGVVAFACALLVVIRICLDAGESLDLIRRALDR